MILPATIKRKANSVKETMTIYVDDPIWPYGRMLMCHMISDHSRKELDRMANAIGLKQKWIQKPGTPEEHYDVSKAKRTEAIVLGALEVTPEKIVQIIRKKRERRNR